MGKKKRKAHLTSEQADALQLYIWDVRNRLNLGHWDVFLAAEPPDEEDEAIASVHPVPGRWVAGVHVCPEWLTLDEAVKRNSITHELLHLVHRDQTEVIRCGLQDAEYLPGKAFTMMWRMFELHTEAMVDHLAGVLAPSMPPCP